MTQPRQRTLQRLCSLFKEMDGIWASVEAIMERTNLSRRAAYDYASAISRIKASEISFVVRMWQDTIGSYRAKLLSTGEEVGPLSEIGLTTCPFCGLAFNPRIEQARRATNEYFSSSNRKVKLARAFHKTTA